MIVESKGIIIGMGALKKVNETTAEIKRMRVDQNHRRKGIGEQILQILEKKAAKKKYTKLVLDVTTELKSAQKLYEKNNYIYLKTIQISLF